MIAEPPHHYDAKRSPNHLPAFLPKQQRKQIRIKKRKKKGSEGPVLVLNSTTTACSAACTADADPSFSSEHWPAQNSHPFQQAPLATPPTTKAIILPTTT